MAHNYIQKGYNFILSTANLIHVLHSQTPQVIMRSITVNRARYGHKYCQRQC